MPPKPTKPLTPQEVERNPAIANPWQHQWEMVRIGDFDPKTWGKRSRWTCLLCGTSHETLTDQAANPEKRVCEVALARAKAGWV